MGFGPSIGSGTGNFGGVFGSSELAPIREYYPAIREFRYLNVMDVYRQSLNKGLLENPENLKGLLNHSFQLTTVIGDGVLNPGFPENSEWKPPSTGNPLRDWTIITQIAPGSSEEGMVDGMVPMTLIAPDPNKLKEEAEKQKKRESEATEKLDHQKKELRSAQETKMAAEHELHTARENNDTSSIPVAEAKLTMWILLIPSPAKSDEGCTCIL